MSKKKNKKLIVPIIIVLVILLIVFTAFFMYKSPMSDDSVMTIRLYDADGNLIDDEPLIQQSVVGGVAGVSFIDLTITATNTGDETLNCELKSATPTQFDNAITKTTETINVGNKFAWTSSLIDVAPFESPTGTTTFEAVVGCSYNPGSGIVLLSDLTGSISITIRPESTGAGFIVDVTQGGTGTEFCGDDICQSDEDVNSCPADCSVASSNVIFRTSDLSYPSGQAIAFTTACGNNLVAYGYETSRNLFTPCDDSSNVQAPALISGIPGNIGVSGAIKLYRDDSDSDKVWLCVDGSSTRVGKLKRYDLTDSDASKVDISAQSFDTAKEVSC